MISKYQIGGLTYQPFQSIIQKEKPKTEQTISEQLLEESKDELPFEVEPVKPWSSEGLMSGLMWSGPTQKQEETPKVSNSGTGKVYTSREKEEFKSDLYNAYFSELLKRGLSEEDASEYAKRIVAQDALESGYGTSSLSKYFNFGGVKDYRPAADSVKTNTKEFINGEMKTKKSSFRKFKDLIEYVNYKIDLLGNSNFDIFSYDPEMLYDRLVSAKRKYATDPNYERKLNQIYRLLWIK